MTEQLRTKQRIAYIDLAKGLACCLMLVGHAISPHLLHMGIPGWMLVALVTVAAPMFFFASGMNVVTFYDAYSKRPGFKVTRFYLLSVLVLFVLSFTYTINRMSFGMWQIFQCIAVSTGVTLLLVRKRLPTWAMLTIFLVGYIIWFRFWTAIEVDLAVIRAAAEDREIFKDSVMFIHSLPPLIRYLFAHFSLLPWVCFVIIGAATYRSIRTNPGMRDRWAIFYAALLVFGLISRRFWPSQPLWLNNVMDLFFRNYPFYFFGHLGATGLFIIALDVWYEGATACRNKVLSRLLALVEFCGKESFVFLIYHWLVLTVIQMIYNPLSAGTILGEPPWKHHMIYVIALPVTLLTLRFSVRLGEYWRTSGSFNLQAGFVLIVGSLLALAAGASGRLTGMLLISFAPCLAFAYSYPKIRLWLRKRYSGPAPAKPEVAPTAAPTSS